MPHFNNADERKRYLAAERQRKRRATLAEDRAAEIRRQHREQMSQQRAQQTPEQAAVVRSQNRDHMSQQRAQLTPEQAAVVRSQNRDHMSQQRAQHTPEQAAEVRIQNTQQRSQQRSQLPILRVAQIRQTEAQRSAIRRAREAANLGRATSERHITFMQPNQDIANEQRPRFAENSIPQHTTGLLNVACQFCGALHFTAERPRDGRFTRCCRKGKLQFTHPAHPYPQFLKQMMTNKDHPYYTNFRKNIRNYNSALSFVSLGANITVPPGRGPYCFQIHGTVFHRMESLDVAGQEGRSYAQLYYLDSTTQATDIRMNHPANATTNRNIMREIADFLNNNNAYAKIFQSAGEKVEEARAQGVPEDTIELVFNKEYKMPGIHEGRQNAPTAQEVAAVFVMENDGVPNFDRDFRVYVKSNADQDSPLRRANIFVQSPHIDPMSYAILFPYGQPGWNTRYDSLPYPEAIPDGEEPIRKHHSMLQYFSALLQVRNNEFWPPIVNAGNLFQQYIVDAYLRKESNDLSWVRLNQNKILAENYTGANNFIQREAQKQGKNSAPAIILPSSFTGSPRNMRQLSEDCLAIFSQMGKPDLFITFTCNPKWKDITDNIVHGETASDRPDITNRVFKIKLDEMIKEIEAGLFGPVVAYVYTIEFQKRGLPHAHILITLQSGYKPKDPASIDKIVCAEIPDKTENPKLYDIITKVMIHGPCRVGLCKDSDDAFCKKGFPKPFLSETQTINNNYPKYKRRQHPAITIQRGNQFMETNNRYVVPYNPYLSLKYDAHINVEIVANMQGAIKYIYKYIFKGYDTASLIVTVNGDVSVDEIKTYMGCRYVSPPEAHWRLFAFQMHDRSHAVIRLQVHLRSLDAEDLMDVPMEEVAIPANNIGITTLTRFFMMNQDPNSPTRTLLYTEMPFFYTWEGRTKMWNHRQQGGDKIVVRMYNVNPAACEKFATRMLLATVRGPQSFEDLYTVNGVLHPTAIAAAQALNLIRNDDVYIQTFNELVQKGMPHQLRRFFASMVMSLTISDALPFWNMYKEHFIEDFVVTPEM